MTKEQEEAHERIEALFEDIKTLAKKDTEKAREKMMIALNLIKKEYNKIK
jgi:RNase P subunit RPR2